MSSFSEFLVALLSLLLALLAEENTVAVIALIHFLRAIGLILRSNRLALSGGAVGFVSRRHALAVPIRAVGFVFRGPALAE